MSEIELIKLIADAGVGVVSLIVLIVVIRTGAGILRANEARAKAAEEARETAITARADAERREHDVIARHNDALTALNSARLDLRQALDHSRSLQDLLNIEMSKVRELRLENERLKRERAELLKKIDQLETQMAALNQRVAELERDVLHEPEPEHSPTPAG
jgi:chromosome segregation ATPase